MTSPRVFIAIACALALSGGEACRGPRAGMEPVTAEEIMTHIRNLSDDLMEGRAVGSHGIDLAATYHEDYFKAFKLEPAFDGGYRQTFRIRGVKSDPKAAVEIGTPQAGFMPTLYEEILVGTEREDGPAEAAGELVYCGYGIQAPEREWDDFKGADLRGKVLLVEINEPGNRPGGIFDGEDMTYYGRWTYKFEKAAELGAAGVLIIHNAKGAAYGWDVLRNPWDSENFFLPEKNRPLYFQGWVTGGLADRIFKDARLDRSALLARAETKEFAPVPLGLTIRVRQRPTFRDVEGFNVAGIIRAKHPAARHRMIIFSAHYDHFGRNPSLEGDQIFNGAVDNCSASACLLALAGYYSQRPERLKDDLCFVAVTGEEKLFLGSDHFVRNLPFDASKAVADINFEMTNVWGETEDVFAIGAKYSDLDDVCRRAAEDAGLRYIPERNGELGFFFRSDQLSFARAGIPGVWLSQGITSRGPDKDYVQRKFEDYRKTKYHKVTDEVQDDWDLRGTLEIVRWAEEIVSLLQEREALPEFLPTSAFHRPDKQAAKD